MRIPGLARPAAMLAAGICAACGSPSQQGAVPTAGALPFGATVRPASHGVSWMGKGVEQQDLLYVSNVDEGVVSVYRYWQHTLVGLLTKFTTPYGECTDVAGDVYIIDVNKIYEYPHGGAKAIRTIREPAYAPSGCAVSPVTDDLAVANFGVDSYGGNIAIFPHGGGRPTYYTVGSEDHFLACGYDKRGHLLAADYFGSSSYYYGHFYYLPKNGAKLLPITLPGPTRSWGWGRVDSILWDGKYWAVQSYNALYRYTINVKAYYMGTVQLSGSTTPIYPLAIYQPPIKSHSAQVVGAVSSSSVTAVDYWNYPTGGDPVAQITKGLDTPYGVAISLGTP